MMSKQTFLAASLVFGLGCLLSGPVLAVENSFVPAAGGYWNVPNNWSLRHCPLPGEHVKIVAGSNDMGVTYNWTGASGFDKVTVDGSSSGYWGALYHPANSLTTTNMYISDNGDAQYFLEGDAALSVSEILYTGYYGTHEGTFTLATDTDNTSAGLWVDDLSYVGYHAPGFFDHTSGIARIQRLYIGQNSTGTYLLKDGRLELLGQFVIGNGNAGTFEQRGGVAEQDVTHGIIMGLNTGGEGTYLMKGGELNVNHISLAWNGNAYFTQTGGTVNLGGDINLGCEGTHSNRAWYKLSEADGTAILNIGDDLLVGVQTLGKYEQTGGTATVTDDLEIWKGATDATSYVYLGTSAGLLDVNGEVINHSGYYDQDGGILTTSHFTNDSPEGVNIDNNADFRARNLVNNAGTFSMWRNAILRGELAFPPSTFWICNFTNNATFRMGSPAVNGGSFRGTLTNNGTFDYYQGDFSTSTLENHGAFNPYTDFTCRRFFNNTNWTMPADRIITANGTGYATAIENNGTLSLSSGSVIDVASSKMVNNGLMDGGGPGSDRAIIGGNLENAGYLLCGSSALTAGLLSVEGDFTNNTSANLWFRISGTSTSAYDRLIVTGTATLGGTMAVELDDGYLPPVGAWYDVLSYGYIMGDFESISLPLLPSDRQWSVTVTATTYRLTIVPRQQSPGDYDGDGEVSLDDYTFFEDCFEGPDRMPQPTLDYVTPQDCLNVFDDDSDGDIDLRDFAGFAARFSS